MPYEVLIERNQLSHTGSLARPLIELWGEGKAVLDGLYNAFLPHGATLAGIRNESTSLSPSDQVIAVTLGSNKVHRFRMDRIESTMLNFSEDDLRAFPALVESSVRWVRSAVPGSSFSSHLFAYTGHGRLRDHEAGDVLRDLGPGAPASGGMDQGTGVAYHWEVPERQWRTQLVLDHSIVVPQALFVMFTLSTEIDDLDYGKLATEAGEYLDSVLRDLGVGLSRTS